MQILVAQLNIRTALEVCPSAPAHFLAGHLRTIAPRILNMFFTLLAHPHALVHLGSPQFLLLRWDPTR